MIKEILNANPGAMVTEIDTYNGEVFVQLSTGEKFIWQLDKDDYQKTDITPEVVVSVRKIPGRPCVWEGRSLPKTKTIRQLVW